MKILVTGASGFIGRHLSSYAAQAGHTVVGTYLSEPELSSRIPTDPRVQWERLDLQETGAIAPLVSRIGPDAVFHLGAQAYAKRAWADPADTFRTNVLGTIALYEALKEHRPANGVLLAASASAYGIPARLPVSEDEPLWATNPYGVSKTCQEAVSYQYAKNFGLRIIRARLFGTTGPGKTGDALNDFARQVARLERAGRPATLAVGNLETKRDIQDVRDAVPALWRLFEAGSPDVPVNVGAGTSHSIRSIVDRLVALAKVPLTVRVDPALLRPTDELDNVADVRRLRALGHTPKIPFEQTVADALDFWRADDAAPLTAPPSR